MSIKITPNRRTTVLIDRVLQRMIKYNLSRVVFNIALELVLSGWLFFID
uniref:Uncharacterized protein n=1 Tax=Myoviridae sp. ctNQr16 TaxID=2826644 RepID=A0A8S5MAS3_9CAUD|nr:MAG TPA: hypothetical protein [Myoviridae sp. ctNQr16]